MTEAKPMMPEEFGGDFESEAAYLRSTVEHQRTAIEQRDDQIKRLRKLLIERGAASEALAVTELKP